MLKHDKTPKFHYWGSVVIHVLVRSNIKRKDILETIDLHFVDKARPFDFGATLNQVRLLAFKFYPIFFFFWSGNLSPKPADLLFPHAWWSWTIYIFLWKVAILNVCITIRCQVSLSLTLRLDKSLPNPFSPPFPRECCFDYWGIFLISFHASKPWGCLKLCYKWCVFFLILIF